MKTHQAQPPELPHDLSLGLAEHRLVRPRAGDPCPACRVERLDYDGLLNLSCPKCGVVVAGCFT